MSSVLVGLLMVGALSSSAQSVLSQRQTANRATGQFLARALLAEILPKEYLEPGSTNPPLGLDAGEDIANRTTLDDVDDYLGYSDSPPKSVDGASLTAYAGWTRNVAVTWVDPSTLAPTGAADTGAKRVSVQAVRNGVVVYTAESYRTNVP